MIVTKWLQESPAAVLRSKETTTTTTRTTTRRPGSMPLFVIVTLWMMFGLAAAAAVVASDAYDATCASQQSEECANGNKNDDESFSASTLNATTSNATTSNETTTEALNIKEAEKVAPTETYRIAAFASPERCLHIEIPNDDDDNSPRCLDKPHWTDGVNGCQAYEKMDHEDWCNKYGSVNRRTRMGTAQESCCVCGGGIRNLVPHALVRLKRCRSRFRAEQSFAVDYITNNNNDNSTGDSDSDSQSAATDEANNNDDSNGKRAILRHVATGATLTFDESNWVRNNMWRGGVYNATARLPRSDDDDGSSEENESGSDDDEDYEMDDSEVAGDILQLVPAFSEEHLQFRGSDAYFTIQATVKNHNKKILISGGFGEEDYHTPVFQNKGEPDHMLPAEMWHLRPVQLKEDKQQDGSEGEEEEETHADWLEAKVATRSGLDRLAQLAPWHLLDVDRDANNKSIKASFRELSRRFHPDKTKNKNPLLEELFVLLQTAYDGLYKVKDEKSKREFQVMAEVEEQLFAASHSVVELTRSNWKEVGNDGKYVLQVGAETNETVVEGSNITDDTRKENGGSENSTELVEDVAQVWLIMLYSPLCGMSRAIRPYVEATAEILKAEHNVKVGAYGCGIYADERMKKKGHGSAFKDPICEALGRRVTPSTHVLVEVISSSTTTSEGDSGEDNVYDAFRNRAEQFHSYYAAAEFGTIVDLTPAKLLAFATAGKRSWDNSGLLEEFGPKDLEDPAFLETARIVAFMDPDDDDPDDIQGALSVALPGVAKRVTKAGGRIGVARCATGAEAEESEETEDNILRRPKPVDCASLDVAWLPDVKIYGANQTWGLSLLGEDFTERRDVQVALEALTNTFVALHGVEPSGDDDDGVVEDGPEIEPEDDEESGGSCGGGSFGGGSFGAFTPPTPGENGAALPEPEENPLLEGGEDPSEVEPPPEAIDGNDDAPPPPKLEGKDKPRLAERSTEGKISADPSKPRLASRDSSASGARGRQARVVGEFDAPKLSNMGHGGGGRVLHRAHGGGDAGAIGS